MKSLDMAVILFPLLSIFTVILVAGAIGIVFTVIHETTHNELGVIILGSAIVVLVPAAAALIQRSIDK